MKAALALTLLVLAATLAGAETVRGSSTTLVGLDAKPDLAPSLNVKADEIVAVSLPEGARFVRAIVAEVVVSDTLRRYADSFAVALYSGVEPDPASDPSRTVFTGRRALFQALPPVARLFVRVPLAGATSDAAGGAARDGGPEPVLVSGAVAAADLPLLLVIQPIMKGIPDSILARPFFVTLKVEVASRGLVDVTVKRPAGLQGAPVRVLLDGREIDPGRLPMEVDAGVHKVEVLSDAFQRETASVAVAPGQTASLEIALSPVASYLTVDSIPAAVVYLDGERLDLAPGQRRQLTEGNHTIRFKIGETNISRRIEIRKGRSYHASLALDVVVKEEE